MTKESNDPGRGKRIRGSGDAVEKWCTGCKKWLAAGAFGRHSSHTCGLGSKCKSCRAETGRHYYRANTEKVREYKRAYYKANPEKGRESRRVYREANPEKGREYARVYREANPEKERERRRVYREANPEKEREAAHRRRARKAGARGTITAADEALIRKTHKDTGPEGCLWREKINGKWGKRCGRGPTDMDHVDSLYNKGSNQPTNQQLLCQKHNSVKGTKSIEYRPKRLHNALLAAFQLRLFG